MPVDLAGRSGRLTLISSSPTALVEKALNKLASASSIEAFDPSHVPGRANDGNTSTRWASQFYPSTGVARQVGAYVGAGNVSGFDAFDAALSPGNATVAVDFTASGSVPVMSTWADIEAPYVLPLWAGNVDVLVLSPAMFPGPHFYQGTPTHTLAAGAAGTYDSHWTALANYIVAQGYTVADIIIRPGWEMNVPNQFAWSIQGTGVTNGAANYATYFQKIVTAMRAVIPGLKFDWCTIRANLDPTAAYPGDAYVDYIGVDTYDYYTPFWTDELADLTWKANFAATHSKPLSIPEWGLWVGNGSSTSGGGDDPGYIQNMYDWIVSHDVAYVGYFNFDTSELSQFPNGQALFYDLFGAIPSGSQTVDEYWQVDLGAQRTVQRFVLTWQTAYAVDYTIRTSDDGTTWTTRATVTANSSLGPLTYDITEVTCRYVRVQITKRSAASATNGWGVSLLECSVWGMSNDTPDTGPGGGNPPPPPPPPGTDSPNGATLPPATVLVVGGKTYRIVGGQIEEAGVIMAYTADVVELFVLNGYLWQRTTYPGFWRREGLGWSAMQTNDPRTPGQPPPPPPPPPPPGGPPTPAGWTKIIDLDFSQPSHLTTYGSPRAAVSTSGGTWYTSNVSVQNGELQIRSDARGSNGGWQIHDPLLYNYRIETRVKMDYGGGAKACILTMCSPWTDWPYGGEINPYEPFGHSDRITITHHWGSPYNASAYSYVYDNVHDWIDVVWERTSGRVRVWHDNVLRFDTAGVYTGFTNGGNAGNIAVAANPHFFSFQIDGTANAGNEGDGAWVVPRQSNAPAWQIFHIDYLRVYRPA